MATPKTMEEHREDLRIAQEAYDRSKTYYNAIAIQQAKNGIDTIAKVRRNQFSLVKGGKSE